MQITDMTLQKRDPNKKNIFVDGNYVFALSHTDVAYFRLEIGKEISEEIFEYIQNSLIYIQAQEKALTYLGYKMRTKKEVEQKLLEKEFSEEIIARVMVFLEDYRYIDDREYAVHYVKERLRLRPRGAMLLRMELKQKGICEEWIVEAIAEANPSEEQDAIGLLEKKLRGNYEIDEKKKKQLYGFLQRKGYSYDTIKKAFLYIEEMGGCDQ